MTYHFDRFQSHRWADHVKAWENFLDTNTGWNRIHDICYERNNQVLDDRQKPYTPIMTALMYGLGMDQKMQIEAKELLKASGMSDDPIRYTIRNDSTKLMGNFLSDAKRLLLGSKFSQSIDDIVFQDCRKIAFNKKDHPEEWKEILTVEPCEKNIDGFIHCYIRARMSQEYWTLNGAVTNYHLIGRFGHDKIKKLIEKNSESLAWKISSALKDVMLFADLDDKNGMTTDHHIEDKRGLKRSMKMLFKPTDMHKIFNNCPIAESYKFVDNSLANIYGDRVGFDEGNMDFCKVCEKHGEQSVKIWTPAFLDVKDHQRCGQPISSGGDCCDFKSTMKITTKKKGLKKKEEFTKKLKNPPRIITIDEL